MELNQAQEQAVAHDKGPMLVLAGPGSGKTMVITERVRRLVQERRVPSEHILVVTFTKAAANEMKERFAKKMGDKPSWVNFGTFHSVFFAILRHAYHFNGSNILREEDKSRFFHDVVGSLDMEIEDENDFIGELVGEISYVKGERVDLANYYSLNCPEETFRQIYQSYQDFLKKRRLIDFDDMMVYCYELFVKRPDVLAMWRERYQYVLIDEFQDINLLQYQIVRMLAEPENNLFIVGDDDQSIYRFRGAKPEIMLNFEKDYPNATRVLLDVNYRCSANILEGASRVIRNNGKRFPKDIRAFHGKGSPIHICHCQNLHRENEIVVKAVMDYHEKGTAYGEMAVLFRTNSQPRALVGALMAYNVPFRLKEALPNLFEHWIARDVIAYMKLARGNRERSVMLQVMNRPKRYIAREALEGTTVDFRSLKRFYRSKRWMVERIIQMEGDLAMLRNMSPFAAIHYIRQGVGYDEYLKEYAEWRRIARDELVQTLDEIQESAKGHESFEEWMEYIDNFTEMLKEQREQPQQEDALEMMTMHRSKGLEFKVVFLLDANEEITPYQKAVKQEDLEEERRMFYVAVTRAKENLHILSVKERYNKELVVSRFVEEIKSVDPSSGAR